MACSGLVFKTKDKHSQVCYHEVNRDRFRPWMHTLLLTFVSLFGSLVPVEEHINATANSECVSNCQEFMFVPLLFQHDSPPMHKVSSIQKLPAWCGRTRRCLPRAMTQPPSNTSGMNRNADQHWISLMLSWLNGSKSLRPGSND